MGPIFFQIYSTFIIDKSVSVILDTLHRSVESVFIVELGLMDVIVDDIKVKTGSLFSILNMHLLEKILPIMIT